MATHAGKEGLLKLSTTTVGEIRGYTFSETSETVEDTVMGDTWKTHLATQRGWTVAGELFWDEADAGQLALTCGSTATFNLYPEGQDSGDSYYQGVGIITSFEVTARHDSVVEASFSAMGTGSVALTTV